VHSVNLRDGLIRPAQPLDAFKKSVFCDEPTFRTAPQMHHAAFALLNRLDVSPRDPARFPRMELVTQPIRIQVVLERRREPSVSPDSRTVVAVQPAAQVV